MKPVSGLVRTTKLCQRASGKAFISGSISNLGSEYVLSLKAVNCQTGDVLAQQQATAASKEKVLESLGGAIISRERFGFGTYDFEMRMSSLSPTPQGDGTASTGAVSSGFIYYNKSESEIDLEFLGNENALWVSSWFNLDPNFDPTALQKTSDKVDEPALATRFRHYSLVWSPKTVDVYIDGTRVAHQTEHVPQNPAHIILQHRGTNSDKWGGVAAVGAERYFFVRSVKFTPLGAK